MLIMVITPEAHKQSLSGEDVSLSNLRSGKRYCCLLDQHAANLERVDSFLLDARAKGSVLQFAPTASPVEREGQFHIRRRNGKARTHRER